MQLPDSPTLTVVVPIYNVKSYLRPCLDSILAGTLTDLDVVCVDDGSTDGSGEVAESYAAHDDRVRVLHVENGGLGRARNIGAQAARGRYLTFADSDDRVPADAYQLMCESLDASGSDLATGRVRRFTETRSWWSGIHWRAIRRGARGTHISRMPTLVYDTTAWNKVFRRSFWDTHGMRFPEGVLYEDIHLMISAHVLAEKVDVLRAPVYEWRVRGDGSLSITQRRAELDNMDDRFTAIHALDDFLIEYGDTQLLREYHLKLLLIDFPLYLDVLDAGDREYQLAFMQHAQRVLQHFDADTLYGGPVWIHVVLELLRRGRLPEALQVLELRRRNEGSYEIVRRRMRVYADLPYLRDRAVGVPDRAYDVTNRQPVHAAVERLAVVDDALVVRGYALIAGTHVDHPWSAVRYLVIRSKNTRHRIVRLLRPQHRPDLTAEFGSVTGGFEFAGFETRIPLDEFKLGDGDEAVYDMGVKILTPGARRGVPLGCLDRSYLKKGPLCVTSDGRHLAAYEGDAQLLRVAVDRDAPLVEDVEIASGTLRCSVRLPAGVSDGARLAWHSDDDSVPAVTADLVDDVAHDAGHDTALRTAHFDLAAFGERPIVAGERLWQASVDTPAGPSRPVLSARDLPRTQAEDTDRPRELAVRIGRRGRLTLIDRAARCRVDELVLDGGELRIGLLLPPALVADTVRFPLQHRVFGESEPTSMTREGRSVSLAFAVIDVARGQALGPGEWTLAVVGPGAGAGLPVEVDTERITSRDQRFGDDATTASLLLQEARVTVRIQNGRQDDRGPRNQHLLRTQYYPQSRRTPLRDLVVFQAWSGWEYSCNPRAIFEEMRRQGRAEDTVWVRSNTAVAVPDGVRWVLSGSREYYDALARARYVVSNDVMPDYYVKRPGSRYLQTWRGTPLKRIGFDVAHIEAGSPRYLDELRADVAAWDQLVSPNRYSSEIFRRAFGYDGAVLETGYPRNDVFFAPNVEEIRAQVRARLGIASEQRVILWAPTWRDDQRDEAGRYSLPLPFELSTWDRILGRQDLLLFRGHQLVRDTSAGMLQNLRSVRNVTLYPDIQDLYLAADVLITDYSSAMFDFANTRRPMVFYAWDLDAYRDRVRGFYLDFESEAPGPLVTDLDGLHDAITDASGSAQAQWQGRYDRFVERYCALDDGKAAARVVDAMFGSR